MSHIFISHAHADNEIADNIYHFVKDRGIKVWIDLINIRPSNKWVREIQTSLNTCDSLLIVLSENWIASDSCLSEFLHALSLKKAIYVAKVSNINRDEFLWILELIQYVDLSKDFEEGAEKLIREISGNTGNLYRLSHITGNFPYHYLLLGFIGRSQDILKVKDKLKLGPTIIRGIGGIGKTRVAVQIALQHRSGVVIWHRASDESRSEEILVSLHKYLDLPGIITRRKLLEEIRNRNLMVVIDNADWVSKSFLEGYLELVYDLSNAGALVLLTGENDEKWQGITGLQVFIPGKLNVEDATRIVLEAKRVFRIERNLTDYANEIALESSNHPGLIQWAVRKAKFFDFDQIVNELKNVRGGVVEETFQKMIFQTIQQMKGHREYSHLNLHLDLKKLSVFRNGFTLAAARDVLQLQDEIRGPYQASVEERIQALQDWQFVNIRVNDGIERYDIIAQVIKAINPLYNDNDLDIEYNHFKHFQQLAFYCAYNQDYSELHHELANLEIAFAWALQSDPDLASEFFSECRKFFDKDGYAQKKNDWMNKLWNSQYEHSRKIVNEEDYNHKISGQG